MRLSSLPKTALACFFDGQIRASGFGILFIKWTMICAEVADYVFKSAARLSVGFQALDSRRPAAREGVRRLSIKTSASVAKYAARSVSLGALFLLRSEEMIYVQ